MDISGDTITPSDVLDGVTFHDRSGAPQTGNLITHNVYDGLDSTSTSDALSANQGRVLNEKYNALDSNMANLFPAGKPFGGNFGADYNAIKIKLSRSSRGGLFIFGTDGIGDMAAFLISWNAGLVSKSIINIANSGSATFSSDTSTNEITIKFSAGAFAYAAYLSLMPGVTYTVSQVRVS